MSRPRTDVLFELGDQWISYDPPSSMLHRFWNDAGTGRTRRESLRTEDIEEAKLKLAELLLKGAKQTPNALLSVILEKYISEQAVGKPSEGIANSASRKLLSFWGDHIRVAGLTEEKQREFAQSIIDDGFSLSYAARIFTVLNAALRHSKISHEVIYTESKMVKHWRLVAKAPRRAFVPSDAEMARVLNAGMPEGLRRWMLIQLATAGRPQTAIDLKPEAREREAGTLNLNPSGRTQNKKFRPIVREPRVLTGWLDKWETEAREKNPDGEIDPLWHYCGYTGIEAVKTALDKLRGKPEVNLPQLTTYSFRHKVTTILRRAKATHGVTEDDISTQLGHRRPHLRTTAGYGEWDPSYLRNAAAAIDQWFIQLQKLVPNRALFSRGYPGTIRRAVRKNPQPIETLGAGEANRTPDPNLGKVMLYP